MVSELLRRNAKFEDGSDEKQKRLYEILNAILRLIAEAKEVIEESDESVKNKKPIRLSCPDTF